MNNELMTNEYKVKIYEKDYVPKKFDRKKFAKLIKKYRQGQKSTTDPENKYLSTKELADRLGITYEQFRKIINMSKPTKKRDCIIAICAALGLDHDEANEALKLYQFMPILSKKNPRDKIIINILDTSVNEPFSIDRINRQLVGIGFPELDIIDHRGSASKEFNNSKYFVVRTHTEVFLDDLAFGDKYDSLESKYDPFRYRCKAEMWLSDKERHLVHLLTGNNGYYYVSEGIEAHQGASIYKKIENTGEYKDYFLELKADINQELIKVYDTLNDTRNYHIRASAKILNDELYVFAESYNYLIPEIEEYCLIEIKEGTTHYLVYGNSEFMHCYLSPDKYKKTYGKKEQILLAQYDSLDEIIEKEKSLNDSRKYLLNSRRKVFEKLIEQSNNLISDLKNHHLYIRNLDYIYDDRDRVCEFYGVEKEFNCQADSENGDIMIAGLDNHDFTFADCGTVNLSLEDLFQAFELGFSNINEICRVKKKNKSIKNILINFKNGTL